MYIKKQGMCYSWILPIAMILGLGHVTLGDETLCYLSGNCYTIYTAALSFQNAVITCGSNGLLATMKNQQEESEIQQFAVQLEQKRNMNAFWIGLHMPEPCSVKNNDLLSFVWISGGNNTQVSKWEKPPRPCPNKKCVILKSKYDISNKGHGTLTWCWKNVKCEKKYPFICRSNDTIRASTTKNTVAVTYSPTEYYSQHYPSSYENTALPTYTSKINVQCKVFMEKATFVYGMNASYGCNGTHCCCRNMERDHYTLKECKSITHKSCLEQCIKASNISCDCVDDQTPCECSMNIPGSSELPVLSSTSLLILSSSSTPLNDDENLLDQLIIPLILGLVAFGILIMLVWGGVQMCVRKKKPKRRKSIVPAPLGSNETDSTDHSSSEEEDDDEDDEEEEEGEPHERTDNP